MNERIDCVEIVAMGLKELYVRHIYSGWIARLSDFTEKGYVVRGRDMLVFYKDLDHSNIPVLEYPKEPVDPYRAYRELERWLGIGVLDHEGP